VIRTQISFEPELYAVARRRAKRLGVSVAELCRKGLRQVLEHEEPKRPWMRYVGSLASGDPGASDGVDDVVYGRPEP
jgi:hypothetical protein